MTSVGGGKPRRQAGALSMWTLVRTNMQTHIQSQIPFFIMRIELFLSNMSSCIIVFARDMNVPSVSLYLSLSPQNRWWRRLTVGAVLSSRAMMKNPAGRNRVSVSSYGRSTARRTCSFGWPARTWRMRSTRVSWRRRRVWSTKTTSPSSPPKRYTHKHTT